MSEQQLWHENSPTFIRGFDNDDDACTKLEILVKTTRWILRGLENWPLTSNFIPPAPLLARSNPYGWWQPSNYISTKFGPWKAAFNAESQAKASRSARLQTKMPPMKCQACRIFHWTRCYYFILFSQPVYLTWSPSNTTWWICLCMQKSTRIIIIWISIPKTRDDYKVFENHLHFGKKKSWIQHYMPPFPHEHCRLTRDDILLFFHVDDFVNTNKKNHETMAIEKVTRQFG